MNPRIIAALVFLLSISSVRALDEADIPRDAPQDAIMAAPAEVQTMLDWASVTFTGQYPPGREPPVRVTERRQDHCVVRFGQSCIETPLRIGQRAFQRGLGTHANSEIVLRLPNGARAFKALVGVDNNFDTGGQRGTVEFAVETAGKELFRSPIRRGGVMNRCR